MRKSSTNVLSVTNEHDSFTKLLVLIVILAVIVILAGLYNYFFIKPASLSSTSVPLTQQQLMEAQAEEQFRNAPPYIVTADIQDQIDEQFKKPDQSSTDAGRLQIEDQFNAN